MLELNFPFISVRFTPSSSFSSHSFLSFTTPKRRQHVSFSISVSVSVRMEQSPPRNRKDKVVVILGATGAGKSRFSIDLATRFPGEIINSDKIQVYDGLEITTNQITFPERRGVPHHLLGELLPEDGEISAAEFRSAASRAISGIVSRGKLPIIAGGSNSFIHALVTECFNPDLDPFSSSSVSRDLRYECCFIWVDVAELVLFEYLMKRVDEMMESGMFEELSDFYSPTKDPGETGSRWGIRKAIGVPEFDRYFRKYPPEKNRRKRLEWNPERKAAYAKAVEEVKENTWRLAKRQIGKIKKLRSNGWDIKRLDATATFREIMSSEAESWRDVWEKEVLEPSVKTVTTFLGEDN